MGSILEITMLKKCFKCGEEKSIDDFYVHKQMGDGHLGKCKECTKKDVREWYGKTFDERREYERKRTQTENRKNQRLKNQKRYRSKYPTKARAVASANKRINQKEDCEFRWTGKCSPGIVHKHHPDYSKPLEVRWLCALHHKMVHLGKLK
jgi:hypothetical protein